MGLKAQMNPYSSRNRAELVHYLIGRWHADTEMLKKVYVYFTTAMRDKSMQIAPILQTNAQDTCPYNVQVMYKESCSYSVL